MKKKTEKQILIEKFVSEPINWPMEMKILGRLLKEEETEFLQFFVIGKKQKSLLWFYCKDGIQERKKQKRIFEQLRPKDQKELVFDSEYTRQTEPKKTIKDLLK